MRTEEEEKAKERIIYVEREETEILQRDIGMRGDGGEISNENGGGRKDEIKL